MKEYIVQAYAQETIDSFDAHNAPELVRCKDCKHWLPMNRFHQDYHPGRGDCELNCWVRDSDWFCADGECGEHTMVKLMENGNNTGK